MKVLEVIGETLTGMELASEVAAAALPGSREAQLAAVAVRNSRRLLDLILRLASGEELTDAEIVLRPLDERVAALLGTEVGPG